MSQQSMQSIIGKAIIDTAFRHCMFADPDTALADYKLSDGEVATLRAIDFETMECCARMLDDRISKAFMISLHSQLTHNRAAAGQHPDDDKEGSHGQHSSLISYNRTAFEGWP